MMAEYKIHLLPPDINKEVREAFGAELATKNLSPQEAQLIFHQAVQPYFPHHQIVGLNSCTAALHLALKLLGAGGGDLVLCPTFTFAASVNPILYQQAIPVFIDSEKESWNMDPELVEEALVVAKRQGKRVAAIMVVHAYGTPAKLDELKKIAASYEVPLLEDAAAAFGTFYKGEMVGTTGDFGAYSFNYNKILTTAGGGLLISRDASLIRQADYLANQARAQAPYYHHEEVGYNYRMNGMAARLGAVQLVHFHAKPGRKKAIFERYKRALEGVGGIVFQEFPKEVSPNYWLTSFLLEKKTARDKVIQRLRQEGIESRMLWRPMHFQPAYRAFPVYNRGIAENLFERGLSLPSSVSLSEGEQQEVIKQVTEGLSTN